MIKSFADKLTQELYAKGKSKKFPADAAPRAARKLEYVDLAEQLEDLKVPPGIIAFIYCRETGRGSMQFQSMISGVSVFVLKVVMRKRCV